MRFRRAIIATAIALILQPAAAGADWLFTPYLGGNTGGDTIDPQANFGVSAAWMGAGVFGFEFDAGWAPDFFDTGNEDAAALVSDSSVGTYMFNLVVGVPMGGQEGFGVRPYGSAGIGAIQTRVESDLGFVDADETAFGWNVGGGVMGFFNDIVGVRGDLRYFGSQENELEDGPLTENIDRFGFWRLTGGVVLRFTMDRNP